MKTHKNNLTRFAAAILCCVLALVGISNILAFFEAVANPGRSGNEPAEILIGGMLFSLILLAVAGVCRIFFERD